MKTCSVLICDKPVLAKGLCNGHYSRVKNGYPLDPERPLGVRVSGERHHNWKGGSHVVGNGRCRVLDPNWPRPDRKSKYIYRARAVMEQHLGRLLHKTEQVHHINGNKLDDRIENLELLSPHDHWKIHWEAGGRENLQAAMRKKALTAKRNSKGQWLKQETTL